MTRAEAATLAKNLIARIPLGTRYAVSFSEAWERNDEEPPTGIEVIGPCDSSLTTQKAEEIFTAFGVPCVYKQPRRRDVVAKMKFCVPKSLSGDRLQALYDSLKVGMVLSSPIKFRGDDDGIADAGAGTSADVDTDEEYGQPVPVSFDLYEY